jgi:GT2 family glycosyltransferase
MAGNYSNGAHRSNGKSNGNGRSRASGFLDALQQWRTKAEPNGAGALPRVNVSEYELGYDEELYLRNNEDVAAAVRGGMLRDGYEHWVRYGRLECAEGRRAGCFEAKDAGGIRPFSVPVGIHGELFVAGAPEQLPDVHSLRLHFDAGANVSLDPSHAVFTRELELTDSSGRAFSQSLLVLWVPAELVPRGALRPSARSVTFQSKTGKIRTVALADGGEQRPSFSGIDAANGFVLAVKRLSAMQRRGAALLAAASDVACAELLQPPLRDEQVFSNVHVEHLVRIEGVGIYASGWLLPSNALLVRCRAWCPETGECVEFDGTMSRTLRPDVVDAFRAKLGLSGAEQFGFFSLLPLPEASRRTGCRVVLGITPEGGTEQVFSSIACKASESFTEAAKLVLSNLNPSASDFETTMSNNVGPALEGLWARERARKSRHVYVRAFGQRPEKPKASVLVPVYGRSDLTKYQLALFANDEDFKAGDIELVYFVDDPRLIEQVSQLCLALYPMYRVPMVVAYTGENHGFSGANNLAASVARGDLLVLLNSDVMPKRSGWVTALSRTYRELPGCGVLGAKLLYYDESLQHDGMIFEKFPFWNGLYGNNHPGKGLPNRSELSAHPREVEAVTGACLVIASAFYREIGGLSEEFVFGDFEDSELCLRARGAGNRIYYAPSVELYHLERQSQSLLPDGDSWRWQLTVYNSWLQHKLWSGRIDELKSSRAPRAEAPRPISIRSSS